ncbi:MAG: tRNA lysidine(34) synthetase TilS [Lachnospiraceae bacterium]|nr:tRNA lysidine(34) synthetase TilS [Lachnospiraceae bacterium]
MDLERKVIAYMKQHHIIKQREKIILGLSGGADSVCLFHILIVCREKYQIEIFAVHVNHKIRGSQAKEDQNFVKKLCESYQVPFAIVEEDVPALAKIEKKSLEETGRIVRYKAFRKFQQELEADYIAVAHHKNDQAETVLHNLCRGSGIAGLAGMGVEQNGIIRPLLCLEREEIEEYLKTKGQPYQIDNTNLDNNYRRNKWRNEIIPLMRTGINAKTISHIADTASIMGEVDSFVEQSGKCAWKRMIETKEKKIILNLEEWKREHTVIQKWIVQNMMYCLSGEQKDIGQVHVLALMELAEKQVGKSIYLPYNLYAKRVYQGLLLEKKEDAMCESVAVYKTLKEKSDEVKEYIDEKIAWEINFMDMKLPEAKVINFSTYQTEKLIVGNGENNTREISLNKTIREGCDLNWGILSKKIPKNNCTKWFDYDKIKGTVLFRRMEQDDFLQIDNVGHHKKIKKLFKDEKVDAKEREKIWLLAEGNHVIWIPGIRTSEAYKVDENTKVILKVEIREEE